MCRWVVGRQVGFFVRGEDEVVELHERLGDLELAGHVGAADEQLDRRLGSLRELFGVLQQVAGDTRGLFEGSIISAEFPNRGEWLGELAKKMGTASQLATIAEMEMVAAAGAKDVLFAFQPVGPNIDRMRQLQEKFPGTVFSALVDDADNLKRISDANFGLRLFVDVDCGMQVQLLSLPPEIRNALVAQLAEALGLEPRG